MTASDTHPRLEEADPMAETLLDRQDRPAFRVATEEAGTVVVSGQRRIATFTRDCELGVAWSYDHTEHLGGRGTASDGAAA